MDIDDTLSRLTKKVALLANAPRLPAESLRSLTKDFLIRYAHETTAIEGNTLTLHETQVVLETGIVIAGKTLREHLEIVNAAGAMIWIEDAADAKVVVSEELILQLHEIMMRGILDRDAGSYRRQAVRIAGSRHVPPNWVRMPEMMERFVMRIGEGAGVAHPIAFAAKAHVELAGIHPFVDGNGRVSRMMANLLLLQSGYPPALYESTNRVQYLETLERAQTDGDDQGFGNHGDASA